MKMTKKMKRAAVCNGSVFAVSLLALAVYGFALAH